MTNIDNTFRVWIGCIACYNAGRLIGKWYDADEAGEVTPEDVHGGYTTHEEIWCYDIENAPAGKREEMSPMEAQRLADVLDAVGEDKTEAFAAYCANTGADFSEDTISDFEDHFCGRFDSFRDYADEIAAETLAQYEINDDHFAYQHFDWKGHAHDLEVEGYWTEDATEGGVYVFSN